MNDAIETSVDIDYLDHNYEEVEGIEFDLDYDTKKSNNKILWDASIRGGSSYSARLHVEIKTKEIHIPSEITLYGENDSEKNIYYTTKVILPEEQEIKLDEIKPNSFFAPTEMSVGFKVSANQIKNVIENESCTEIEVEATSFEIKFNDI